MVPPPDNSNGGVRDDEDLDADCLDFSCHDDMTFPSTSQASDDIFEGFLHDALPDTATMNFMDGIFSEGSEKGHTMTEDPGTIMPLGEHDNIRHFDSVKEGAHEGDGGNNRSSIGSNSGDCGSGNRGKIDDIVLEQKIQQSTQVSKEGVNLNSFEPVSLNRQEEYQRLRVTQNQQYQQRSSRSDFMGTLPEAATDVTDSDTMASTGLSNHQACRRRVTVDSVMPLNIGQFRRGDSNGAVRRGGALHESFTENRRLSEITMDTSIAPTLEFQNHEQISNASATRRRRATVGSGVAPTLSQLLSIGNTPQKDWIENLRVEETVVGRGDAGSRKFSSSLQTSHQTRQAILDSVMAPDLSCVSNDNDLTQSHITAGEKGMGFVAPSSANGPPSSSATVNLGMGHSPSGPGQLFNGNRGSHHSSAVPQEKSSKTNPSPFGNNMETPAPPPATVNLGMGPGHGGPSQLINGNRNNHPSKAVPQENSTKTNPPPFGDNMEMPAPPPATVNLGMAPRHGGPSQLFNGKCDGHRSMPHGNSTKTIPPHFEDDMKMPVHPPTTPESRPKRRRATVDSSASLDLIDLQRRIQGMENLEEMDQMISALTRTKNLLSNNNCNDSIFSPKLDSQPRSPLDQQEEPHNAIRESLVGAPSSHEYRRSFTADSGVPPNRIQSLRAYSSRNAIGMGAFHGSFTESRQLSEPTMETNPRSFKDNPEMPLPPPIKPESHPKRHRRATVDSAVAPTLKNLQSRIKDVGSLEELDEWISTLTQAKKIISISNCRDNASPQKPNSQRSSPVKLNQQEECQRMPLTQPNAATDARISASLVINNNECRPPVKVDSEMTPIFGQPITANGRRAAGGRGAFHGSFTAGRQLGEPSAGKSVNPTRNHKGSARRSLTSRRRATVDESLARSYKNSARRSQTRRRRATMDSAIPFSPSQLLEGDGNGHLLNGNGNIFIGSPNCSATHQEKLTENPLPYGHNMELSAHSPTEPQCPWHSFTVDSCTAPNPGHLLGGDSSRDEGGGAIVHQTHEGPACKKKNLNFHEALQKLEESRKRTEFSRRQLEMIEQIHPQPQEQYIAASAQQQLQQQMAGSPCEMIEQVRAQPQELHVAVSAQQQLQQRMTESPCQVIEQVHTQPQELHFDVSAQQQLQQRMSESPVEMIEQIHPQPQELHFAASAQQQLQQRTTGGPCEIIEQVNVQPQERHLSSSAQQQLQQRMSGSPHEMIEQVHAQPQEQHTAVSAQQQLQQRMAGSSRHHKATF